jgi:hypothetical protein
MITRLIPTKEFTDCVSNDTGVGPWSDRANKNKIYKAWKTLDNIFGAGVSGEALTLSNALMSPGRRRRFLPNSFGPLYQTFSEIEGFDPKISGLAEDEDAYLCIIPFEKFQLSCVCAFIGGDKPRFFVIFASSALRCKQRHETLCKPKNAKRFFKSLARL